MPDFSVPDIIRLGDISVPLSANYNYDGEVLGKRLATTSPLSIAIVTDALRWHYEGFPPTSITNAVGSITITNVGNDGDKIEVFVNDVELGLISLGSYIKQPTDTTVNILATSIYNALTNLYGYTTSLLNATITITVRPGLGDSMNGGSRLQPALSFPTLTASTIPAFSNQVVNTNSISKMIRVSGTLLYGAPGNITITAPTDFQVSNDNSTWGSSTTIPFTSDTISNIPVYVRFSPTSTGTKSGNVSITGGGTLTATLVPVSGLCVAVPALTATALSAFANTNVGFASAPQTFDLSGVGLTNAPGVITITAPSLNFQVSNNGTTWGASTTIPYTSDILSTIPVYVRYSPQAPGTPSGNIAVNGGGASTTVAVSGTSTPELTAGSLTAFANTVSGSASASQTFSLSGLNLTGAPSNITVTSPNTDFQVSLNGTAWGASVAVPYTSTTLASTNIYVRFTPQSTGTKSGNVSISGGSATTNVAVSGLGVVEVYFDALGLTQIKFDNIDTTNGFSILWKAGDEQTFASGNQTNITKSYLTPYTGQIKIRATSLADIKKINIAEGGNAPQPINNSTFTVRILQSELVKLTGLLDFTCPQSCKLFGATTLNLNRSLENTIIRYSDMTGDIKDFPVDSIKIEITGATTFSGSINDMFANCPGLTWIWLSPTNTISGNISAVTSDLEHFFIGEGNTITGDLTSLGSSSDLVRFVCNGNNTIYGNIENIDWTSLQLIEIGGSGVKTGDIDSIAFATGFYHFNFGGTANNAFTGSISSFPSTVTFLRLGGSSTVSGTTADVPTSCTTLVLVGTTELTGDVSSLPSVLQQLNITGATSALTGTINDLPSNLRFVKIENNVHDVSGYTSGRSWGTLNFTTAGQRTMCKFSITGTSVTPLDQTESNNLLIDLNNTAIWQNSTSFTADTRAVNYTGLTPTGAGITAKTGLEAKGVVVTTY